VVRSCLIFLTVAVTLCAQGAESPKTRADLLARMEIVMGKLPGTEKKCPLDVQVTEEIDCGDHIRKFLTYQSEPGARVPAYLLIPKPAPKKGKAIGILTLHQTHKAGQKVVVGLGESPNDEYAVELVRRGYICLAPAYPHLANYAPDLSGYQSGTMKAIWDNIRGLDLLGSYADADPNSFAAIGHSLGGHNSLYTASFDERIKVVATSCGFDSFRDYMNGDIKGWTSARYMPKLLEYSPDRYPFDFDTVLAAIAPRTVLVSAPKADSNFKWESVDRVVKSAEALSASLGKPAVIRVEHPDCEHSFPKETRERMYKVFDKILRGAR
jgi:hypothetical protein